MPSTVADLFSTAGLSPAGVSAWGTSIAENRPGNYIVALTDDAHSLAGSLPNCPVNTAQIRDLLDLRPELRLHGSRSSVDDLVALFEAFWMPDEVALYIGLAGTSLRSRVDQYYRTPIGARAPHAGGWWLKTLSVLDNLWVHFAPTPDNEMAEEAMLRRFATSISTSTRERLPDRTNPAPFANLRTGRGGNKAHGVTGATGATGYSRRPTGRSRELSSLPPEEAARLVQRRATPDSSIVLSGQGGNLRSQRITPNDLAKGQIRFPRPAKRLFPTERTDDVAVVLRGHKLSARWNPGTDPDKERSGRLSLGKNTLAGLLSAGEVLTVTLSSDGYGVPPQLKA